MPKAKKKKDPDIVLCKECGGSFKPGEGISKYLVTRALHAWICNGCYFNFATTNKPMNRKGKTK